MERSPRFAVRLDAAIARVGAPACVGIDPVFEKLPHAIRAEHWEPVRAIDCFCHGVLDAVRGIAAAVKFQSACFERHGSAGMGALERSIARARTLGFVVILDAKRQDIGISAEHYAAGAAHAGADAITVGGYMGAETIEPFLGAGLGVFVLVRTSNPGGDEVQSARVEGGQTVAEAMGAMVSRLGDRFGSGLRSDVGAVVGATKTSEARGLRAVMPRQYFLVPGYGAQGGSAEDARAMLDGFGGGVLINASRSVLYPAVVGKGWVDDVRAAAEAFRADISSLVS